MKTIKQQNKKAWIKLFTLFIHRAASSHSEALCTKINVHSQ